MSEQNLGDSAVPSWLAEDTADIRAADAARAEMRETGQAPIPWDEVKADLGL